MRKKKRKRVATGANDTNRQMQKQHARGPYDVCLLRPLELVVDFHEPHVYLPCTLQLCLVVGHRLLQHGLGRAQLLLEVGQLRL